MLTDLQILTLLRILNQSNALTISHSANEQIWKQVYDNGSPVLRRQLFGNDNASEGSTGKLKACKSALGIAESNALIQKVAVDTSPKQYYLTVENLNLEALYNQIVLNLPSVVQETALAALDNLLPTDDKWYYGWSVVMHSNIPHRSNGWIMAENGMYESGGIILSQSYEELEVNIVKNAQSYRDSLDDNRIVRWANSTGHYLSIDPTELHSYLIRSGGLTQQQVNEWNAAQPVRAIQSPMPTVARTNPLFNGPPPSYAASFLSSPSRAAASPSPSGAAASSSASPASAKKTLQVTNSEGIVLKGKVAINHILPILEQYPTLQIKLLLEMNDVKGHKVKIRNSDSEIFKVVAEEAGGLVSEEAKEVLSSANLNPTDGVSKGFKSSLKETFTKKDMGLDHPTKVLEIKNNEHTKTALKNALVGALTDDHKVTDLEKLLLAMKASPKKTGEEEKLSNQFQSGYTTSVQAR